MIKPITIQPRPTHRLYGWVISIMTHIAVVTTKPMIVLIGISRPLILIFPPSLKGRFSSGFLTLRLRMEAWANIKASRDPKA